MDKREFVRRKAGGPVRMPSRRNGPPRVLWVLLALVVIAAVVLLVIFFTKKSPDEDEGGTGSPDSQPVSQVSEPDASGGASPTPEPSQTPEPSLPDQSYPDSAPTDMGSFMIAGGHGFDYYDFNQENTNNFILAVENISKKLPASANFYSIVVPTAMDVTLKESYLLDNNIDSSDQRKAIDSYIYPSITAMAPSVKTVPAFDPLRQHCGEYIYFNSDRTWTQLGAYYVYRSFCSVKGVEPASLDSFTKSEYGDFYGGFYRESGSDSLYSDTVEAYAPGGNTSLSFTDSEGAEYEGWAVIADGDSYDSSLLYLIFAAGDQPYKLLENGDITDNSACVVVQDSYGNYFIPFLTRHYQKVYVVDYRTYSHSVTELINEAGASDVILLTNVLATSGSSVSESLNSIF